MRVLRLVPAALLIACGGSEAGGSGELTDLPVFTLSGPTLEIGAIEGAPEYLFASIESTLRLPDGDIVVSDPGNTRISIYDERGAYVRSFGSEGDGPGEFRALSRLYLQGADSLLAVDQRTRTVTAWHLSGEPGDARSAVELSGDSTFALDSWLYGRFWVEGALTATEREGVKAALDRVPPPRTSPGYRYVRMARSGELWIREPGVSADGVRTWTRLSASGTPDALVQAPAAFDPIDIGREEVVGRWTGEADVNFVRVYGLADAGARRPVPAWIDGLDSLTAEAEGAPDEDDLREMIMTTIKAVASAQEIHYAGNYSYTSDVTGILDGHEVRVNGRRQPFEMPEGLEITIPFANSRGWIGIFAHPGLDRVCGLAYGFNIPPGWTPGMVMCAVPTSAADQGMEG